MRCGHRRRPRRTARSVLPSEPDAAPGPRWQTGSAPAAEQLGRQPRRRGAHVSTLLLVRPRRSDERRARRRAPPRPQRARPPARPALEGDARRAAPGAPCASQPEGSRTPSMSPSSAASARHGLGLQVTGPSDADIEVVLQGLPATASASRGERRDALTWVLKRADLDGLHLMLGDAAPDMFDVQIDVLAPSGVGRRRPASCACALSMRRAEARRGRGGGAQPPPDRPMHDKRRARCGDCQTDRQAPARRAAMPGAARRSASAASARMPTPPAQEHAVSRGRGPKARAASVPSRASGAAGRGGSMPPPVLVAVPGRPGAAAEGVRSARSRDTVCSDV